MLSSLVQAAINDKVLVYRNTFLVRPEKTTTTNTTNPTESPTQIHSDHESLKQQSISSPLTNSKISSILDQVRICLYDELHENKNYLPLAQLQQKISKRLKFKLKIFELGFSKLRGLVEHFSPEIQLESFGDNHYYVKLREDIFQQESVLKDQHFEPILDGLEEDEKFKTTAPPWESHSLKNFGVQPPGATGNISWNGGLQVTRNPKDWKLTRILATVTQLVQEAPNGIEITDLHLRLNKRLGIEEFNPKIFGYDYFHLFLLNYGGSYLDIQMGMKKGRLFFTVYPKNLRFKNMQDNIHQQQSNKLIKLKKQNPDNLSVKKRHSLIVSPNDKLSTSLKLSSEPFRLSSPRPRSNIYCNLSNIGQPKEREHKERTSSKNVISNWAAVMNTSFLDELPSISSQKDNLSLIKHPQAEEEVNEAITNHLNAGVNNKRQNNATHQILIGAGGDKNNQSVVELKEYLDCLNQLLPDKNEELRKTFFSLNDNSCDFSMISFQNSELSLILKNSMLHNSSYNHRRLQSLDKNLLRVVKESYHKGEYLNKQRAHSQRLSFDNEDEELRKAFLDDEGEENKHEVSLHGDENKEERGEGRGGGVNSKEEKQSSELQIQIQILGIDDSQRIEEEQNEASK